MISRRSFLLGIGSIVTSAFVTRAKAHLLETRKPLLIRPDRSETKLYLYEGVSDDPLGGKYRVSLGPDQWPAPAPPSWREYLRDNGYTFESPSDDERAYAEWSLLPEDLDEAMEDEYAWEEHWEHDASPQARAYQLLTELQLDCDPAARGRTAGGMFFTEWGGHPGSSERWVDLRDDLSVSILQARLTERELPIKIVMASL